MPDFKGISTKHEIIVRPAPEALALGEKLATGQAVGFGLILGLLLAGLIYAMTRRG